MDNRPKVGWNRVPGKPGHFRYWNGRQWTAAATKSDHGWAGSMSISGRRRIWHHLYRNTVIFHALAWLNCSVPGVRGRLDRFQPSREFRTLNTIEEV